MKENGWLWKKVKELKAEVELQRRHHIDEENEPAANSLGHIMNIINRLFPEKLTKIKIHGYCVICEKPILDNQTVRHYDRKKVKSRTEEMHAHEECVEEQDPEAYKKYGIPPEIIRELEGGLKDGKK